MEATYSLKQRVRPLMVGIQQNDRDAVVDGVIDDGIGSISMGNIN